MSADCFGCHPSSFRVRSLEAGQSIAATCMNLPNWVGYFLGGFGDDRHVQAAADHASDVSERHALVGKPVIPGSCGALLKHESVEMSRIEPMHRGPGVEPVAQICRNALFPRDADESRIGRRGKSSANIGAASGPKYGPRNI